MCNDRRSLMNKTPLLSAAIGSVFLLGCAMPTSNEAPARYVSVSTLAGSGTAGTQNGTGTAAQLNRPHGMAVAADGTVYVSDRGNHQIRAIRPDGSVRA